MNLNIPGVPSSRLDKCLSDYLKKNPDAASTDENGQQFVDFVLGWNAGSGTYELEGVVPAGYRRHSKHGLTLADTKAEKAARDRLDGSKYPVVSIDVQACFKDNQCTPCTKDERCKLFMQYSAVVMPRHGCVVFVFKA